MPVQVFTTKGNDIVLAVVGCALGAVGLWGALFGFWSATPSDFQGVRYEGLVLFFFRVFGPGGMAFGSAILAAWTLSLGIGGIWRLLKRGPALAVGRDGLRFHRSIGPGLVEWRDVVSIHWIARRPGEIEIKLAFRTWSLWNWATSTTIRLNHVAIGLSWKQAAAAARAMRAERSPAD